MKPISPYDPNDPEFKKNSADWALVRLNDIARRFSEKKDELNEIKDELNSLTEFVNALECSALPDAA